MIKRVFTILVCVHLMACATHRAPLVSGIPLGTVEAGQALEELRTRSAGPNSFKALYRTIIRHGQEKDLARHAIIFERPDKMRIETLPRDAVWTISLLTSRAGEMTLLEPEQKNAWILKTNPETLRRVIGIPIDVQDLMSVLVGHVPADLLRADRHISIFRNSATGILGFKSDLAADWTTDAQGNLQTLELFDQFNQKLTIVISYSNFQQVGKLSIPKNIKVEMPRDALEVELAQSSVGVNPKISDKLFSVDVPADYSIEHQLR